MSEEITDPLALPIGNEKIKLEPQVEAIIKTVYERCKKEKESNQLQIPLHNCEERVSYYTAMPVTSICHLDVKKHDPENSLMNLNCHLEILKCLKYFYMYREYPTFKSVYDALRNQKLTIPEYSRFQQLFCSLGFEYKKTSNGNLLIMEDPKLTFDRYHYLHKIKRFRENKVPIYYIDERIIDSTMTFKKPHNIENVIQDGYMFLHVVSNSTADNGLFCCQGGQDFFYKWIINIVLPSLKRQSVIVMDNNILHSEKVSKKITKYHSKNDMTKWLEDNSIPFGTHFSKAELYSLVEKYTPIIDTQFKIDQVLQAYGHTVLRLPTNFSYLSPTELLWNKLKAEVKRTDVNSLVALKDEIKCKFLDLAVNMWDFFEKRIEKIENEIISHDKDIEAALNNKHYHINHNCNNTEIYCSGEVSIE